MPQTTDMTLDQLNATFNSGTPTPPASNSQGYRSDSEVRNLMDQMQSSGHMVVDPAEKGQIETDLRSGADVNIPGVTGNSHKLVTMPLSSLNGGSEEQPKNEDLSNSIKGTLLNTLTGFRDFQNMPGQAVANVFKTLTQKTKPGRPMTPDEQLIAKNLGYGGNKWGSMSDLSADEIKNAARVNPEIPGILNYLGKTIGGETGEALAGLNNVFRGVADNSIPVALSKIDPAAKERVRYAQVQSILASSQMLAHPEGHTKEQLDNAAAVMQQYREQSAQAGKSTKEELKDMGSAIAEHPGAAVAGLANTLLQDPEAIMLPVATAGRVGKMLEGAGAAAKTAAKATAGAAEGAGINAGFYAAQTAASPEGVVTGSGVKSNAAVGAALGGLLGAAARDHVTPVAPESLPPELPTIHPEAIKPANVEPSTAPKVEESGKGQETKTFEAQQYDKAIDQALDDYAKAMAKGDADAMEAATESINKLNSVDPAIRRAEAAKRVSLPKEQVEPSAETPQPTGATTLPRNLAGAKPTYFFGNKRFSLNFADDLDKAAYIIAGKNPSKSDAAYLKFVQDATGLSEADARAYGQAVRNTIKGMARDNKPGALDVPKHEGGKGASEAAPSAAPTEESIPENLGAPPGGRQSGNVDPELLKTLAIRTGLVGAGATAGAIQFPEDRKKGALLGGAAGLSLGTVAGMGDVGARGLGRLQKGAFGGEKAAGADLGKLELAKDAARQGASPSSIWRDTGWYHDIDGKWKFEIPDSDAKLDFAPLYKVMLNGETVKASDIMKHQELWKSYPEIGNTKVKSAPLGGRLRALVDANTGDIILNSDPSVYGKENTSQSMKAILLHELQHKIQATEDFARGGNPEHSMTFPEFNDELNKIMQDMKDRGLDPKLLKDADKASLIDKAGFNVYQRLKGEVEARAVQERSTYSPHMLKNIPPERTQALDIPERQQIVVRGRNQAASLPDKSMNDEHPIYVESPRIDIMKQTLLAPLIKAKQKLILESFTAPAEKQLSIRNKIAVLDAKASKVATQILQARRADAKAQGTRVTRESLLLQRQGYGQPNTESSVEPPGNIIDEIKQRQDVLTRARESHAKFEEIAATSDNPLAKEAVKQSAADVRAKENALIELRSSKNSLPEPTPVRENLDLPDQDKIVAGVKVGDRRSIETFYKHFAPILKKYASSFAHTIKENGSQLPLDPGELAHVALTKGIEKISMFKGDSSLGTWLTSILRNEALMELRKGESRIKPTSIFADTPNESGAARTLSGQALGQGEIEGATGSGLKPGIEKKLSDTSTPESNLSSKQTQKILARTFKKMGSDQQKAMEDFYFNNKPTADIAKEMNVPDATVRQWLARGRVKVKEAIERDNIAFEGVYNPMTGKEGGFADPALLKEMSKKLAIAGIGATAGMALSDDDHKLGGALKGAGLALLIGAISPRAAATSIKNAFKPGKRVTIGDLGDIHEGEVIRAQREIAKVRYQVEQLAGSDASREKITRFLDGEKIVLTPEEAKAAGIAKQFFATLGELGTKSGVLKDTIENYVTHLWGKNKENQSIIDALMADKGTGLPTETRFSLKRVIPTIKAGEGAGLKPATLDISKIMDIYANSVVKAIANRRLLKGLKETTVPGTANKLMMPSSEAPKDYVSLNHPQLFGLRVHPDIAGSMKFYFNAKGPGPISAALQGINMAAKRMNVSFSAFHLKALFDAMLGAAQNPITAITTLASVARGTNKALNELLTGGAGDRADLALRSGLKIQLRRGALIDDDVSTQFYEGLNAASKLADRMFPRMGTIFKGVEKVNRFADTVMWEKAHAAMKLETFYGRFEAVKNNIAKGVAKDPSKTMPSDLEIGKMVAAFTNDSFGGLNWRRIAEGIQNHWGHELAAAALSPAGRRGLQLMLFAPDWTLSTARAALLAAGKGSGLKGIIHPRTVADLHRNYLLRSAIIYSLVADTINMQMSGHHFWENDDPTRIDMGDGRTMQWSKHSMEAVHWFTATQQQALNKMGIIPSEALNQLLGSEYLHANGDAPKMKSHIGHALKRFLPITAQSEQTGWAGPISSFFGAPIYGKKQEESGGKKYGPGKSERHYK